MQVAFSTPDRAKNATQTRELRGKRPPDAQSDVPQPAAEAAHAPLPDGQTADPGRHPAARDGQPAAPDGLTIFGVSGLPDIRPGDDLAALIAGSAAVFDGDVLVVTSKIVSKAEGRLVPSPTAVEERDALRRRLIDEQTVRLVAQMGRTKIVENRLGIVAAAAGIDASNVRADEIALLPEDPDASAEALVNAFAPAASGSAWWSPTPRAEPGATGSPTSRSARPGSRCSTTIAAGWMRSAISWWSPRWRRATSWPPRPIW